jgi:hypothetical protein
VGFHYTTFSLWRHRLTLLYKYFSGLSEKEWLAFRKLLEYQYPTFSSSANFFFTDTHRKDKCYKLNVLVNPRHKRRGWNKDCWEIASLLQPRQSSNYKRAV